MPREFEPGGGALPTGETGGAADAPASFSRRSCSADSARSLSRRSSSVRSVSSLSRRARSACSLPWRCRSAIAACSWWRRVCSPRAPASCAAMSGLAGRFGLRLLFICAAVVAVRGRIWRFDRLLGAAQGKDADDRQKQRPQRRRRRPRPTSGRGAAFAGSRTPRRRGTIVPFRSRRGPTRSSSAGGRLRGRLARHRRPLPSVTVTTSSIGGVSVQPLPAGPEQRSDQSPSSPSPACPAVP